MHCFICIIYVNIIGLMMTNVNTDYGAQEHKKRTRLLIEKGGLVHAVGLAHLDEQLLTGLLLQSKAYLEKLTPAQCNALRLKGADYLNARRKEKEQIIAALPAMEQK